MNKSLTFESIYNELMTRYGGLDIENLAIKGDFSGYDEFLNILNSSSRVTNKELDTTSN